MAEVQQLEAPVNGGATIGASSETLAAPSLGLATKRQRRPSVRLGDIGDQRATTISYDSFVRRTKQWSDHPHKYRFSFQKDPKTSKTRPLTNLSNGGGDIHEAVEFEDKNVGGDANLPDLLAIGSRKARRGLATKRVRSNWATKVDEGGIDEKLSGEEGGDEGFRDFDPEGSESPLKEQSPIHSLENPDRGLGNERKAVRARVSESRDHEPVELDGPSDTDARDWKCGTSADRNGVIEKGRCWSLEDGVRMWLNGLGLGRYSPVFEIHEVDEEVLPLLTIEDLRDMGIYAVGSRRKLYCAIQKLGKGFS